MHTVKVLMRANQTIFINGQEVNVHDLESITVSEQGVIVEFQAAQQKMHPTNGMLCAVCSRPEYAHSPNGHDFRPAISG